MSIILGVLHLWMEIQISNQLKLPQSKSKLIELVLKVESTTVYQGHSSRTNAFQSHAMEIDNGDRRKGEKSARLDTNLYRGKTLAPASRS